MASASCVRHCNPPFLPTVALSAASSLVPSLTHWLTLTAPSCPPYQSVTTFTALQNLAMMRRVCAYTFNRTAYLTNPIIQYLRNSMIGSVLYVHTWYIHTFPLNSVATRPLYCQLSPQSSLHANNCQLCSQKCHEFEVSCIISATQAWVASTAKTCTAVVLIGLLFPQVFQAATDLAFSSAVQYTFPVPSCFGQLWSWAVGIASALSLSSSLHASGCSERCAYVCI